MQQQEQTTPPTNKTKDDFLRWLSEKKAHAESDADRQAMMVWVDDGGPAAPPAVEGDSQPGG